MIKTAAVVLGVVLALVACEAQAATSMSKKYGAGPAIQGNSDQVMPKTAKKKHMMHKKAM